MIGPVLYIHGAYSEPGAFAALRAAMPDHEGVAVSYDARDPLDVILHEMDQHMTHLRPRAIVGHSFGGVLAAHMSRRGCVRQLVTLASPLGGIQWEDVWSWMVNGIALKAVMKGIAEGRPITTYPDASKLIAGLELEPPEVELTSVVAAKDVVIAPSRQVPATAWLRSFTQTVEADHMGVLTHEDTFETVGTTLFM